MSISEERLRELAVNVPKALKRYTGVQDLARAVEVLLPVLEAAKSYKPHHDCDCWTSMEQAIAAADRVLGSE